MNIFKLLQPFSFSEKIQVIQYRLGKILLKKCSEELKACYNLTSKLLYKEIQVVREGNNVLFPYLINNNSKNFKLKIESSDIHVFQQIILEEEYGCIIELLEKHHISCKNMIDAGSNIGLTLLFFKSFYPDVNIIAMEPSEETFKRLESHCKLNNLQNVSLLKKGLWSHSTRLKGDDTFRDGRDWSFRLIEAEDSEQALIEVVSVSDLLFENKIQIVDFLKIDIEGSEAHIFKKDNDLSWLNHIKIIAIEIHHEFKCQEVIETLLKSYGFELSYSGELTIGLNKNLVE